jgi:O-antigen ligase
MDKSNAMILMERLELICLCTLAVVMPIMESPKTIAFVLFAAMWFARRVGTFRKGDFNKPDVIEICVFLLILSAVVSTAINWPMQSGLKGLKDAIVYCVLFLCIYNGKYSDRQKYAILTCLVSGVLVGLAWGVIEIYQGKRTFLELHSAGIVTQSSMYVGMAVIVAFSLSFIVDRGQRKHTALWVVAFLITLAGLIFMASRGSILATAFAFLVLMLSFRSKKMVFGLISVVVALFLLMAISPDWFQQKRFVEKMQQHASNPGLSDNDRLRFSMWKIALGQFIQGDSKTFGVGPRNFPSIDMSKLKLEGIYIPGKMLDHAHNMFLNKLVEEGVVGLSVMLLFFVVIACALVKDYRDRNWRNPMWSSAVGALLIPAIAGSFNTPWKQEHAMFAMMLFALYMSSRRGIIPDRKKVDAG